MRPLAIVVSSRNSPGTQWPCLRLVDTHLVPFLLHSKGNLLMTIKMPKTGDGLILLCAKLESY